ncbi:hypothetical protein [Leuconostoc citreum]|uniref:hypothetical protein n=1 Tax=Leuconostoc citreum TaxID=33964 RepID=UPI0032DF1EDE
MFKLFPRGIRVRYWHRHLRRDIFLAIGCLPIVFFIIYTLMSLLKIMPSAKGVVSFFTALLTTVDWLSFGSHLLPALYITLFSVFMLMSLTFYWYVKTYQFQGFWATVFRLERLANWLLANQYYLVKEIEEKEKRSLNFNLSGEKGGWHW